MSFRPKIYSNFSDLKLQITEIENLSGLLLQKMLHRSSGGLVFSISDYIEMVGKFDCSVEANNLVALQKACSVTREHIESRVKIGRPISRDKEVIVSQLSYLISAIERYGGKASVNNPEISEGGSLTAVLNCLKKWGYLTNKRLANSAYSHTKEARSRVNRRNKARKKVDVASIVLKART
ncbi:hypothetical protein [Chthonobacter rhizosphaerae]|uniref:hypothetical protein n=1 Tax=Chthonobacter rhizosphaerae TaxID=2735553 RepID=UPI0015EF617D|nr:hypothetical protein [Chthonobacter rhizosphaerae]